MKNYYYILSISPSADLKEVKAAYRKLSQKFHPDKNSDDVYFSEYFKEINEAYPAIPNLSNIRNPFGISA
ncbi:MAG: DnaJ domain-containing protein [Bacteroidales bacterium]|nr:DnaJ domain-containing protein [Bacteroidales bacterium]MCF8455210.1 DnaJ domain-containing protein [Bacteroidales bacterium]